MNVEAFLRSAGEVKDQDDVKYLEHVKNSPAGKLFDFEKYYWVSPIVRDKIVTAYENDINYSKMILPEEKVKYLDLKLGYIIDQLEEEHSFLMSIKDMPLTEYLSRMRFEIEFLKMNYLVNLYDHQYHGLSFDFYENKIRENQKCEEKKFKKMKTTSTILLLISIVIIAILLVAEAPTLSIITSILAGIVCIAMKVSVGRLYKKGIVNGQKV